MKLKTKILYNYGLILCLLGLTIIWALANIITLGQASEAILKENYRSISSANEMIYSLDSQKSILDNIYILPSPKDHISALQKKDGEFIEWLSRAKDNITILGEADLVEEINILYTDYRLYLVSLVGIISINNELNSSDINLYKSNLASRNLIISTKCHELLKMNEKIMYKASEDAKLLSRKALISTLIIAFLTFIISIIFSFILSERIVRPIHIIGNASRRLSEGDYSIHINIKSLDELGELANEFNRMASQLKKFNTMNIDQILIEKSKLDTIISSIEDGIIVFNNDLSISGINPAAQNILYLKGDYSVELNLEAFLKNSIVLSVIRDTFQNNQLTDIPEEDRTIIIIDKKNISHYYQFSLSIICGKEKLVSGIVLMLRNITKMKELENLKSEFVMAASHELRTPLTSLGMSIELLSENISGKCTLQEQDLLDTAKEEISHMKSLTNDLLELSKLESGRIELDYTNVFVESLFEYISTIFKKQLDFNSINFSMEIMNESLSFYGDMNKISWVLSNLISNAMRYVPNGGQIKISAVKIGFNIHISTEDSGPGIPPEYQSRIFQKFSQIKGRESGGSGLGLAICREIVRAHGGTIWVESQLEKGSVFTFTIPMGI